MYCGLSKHCTGFVFFCLFVRQSNDNIKEGNKWILPMCEKVRQPKYVGHIFGGAGSKKYSNSTNYYDTPKYVEGPCQRYTDSSREQKSPTRYDDFMAGSSCPFEGSWKFLFRGLIRVTVI